MQLFLFGGSETELGQAPSLKNLIQEVIDEIRPKQLLHIPHARLIVPKGEELIWGEGWVERDLKLDGVELLDARSSQDISRAENPLVFVNGGPQHDNLYEAIIKNKKLLDIVLHCKHYIGESAGAMMVCEYRRTYNDDTDEYDIKPGLGIIKNVMIEAHYFARKGQALLKRNVKQTGVNYGIGIDSLSGIRIDDTDAPLNYFRLGSGNIEIITNHESKY